ncbi:hypothetical protein GCM10017771_93210 [Streptomyces capitiformicae]|uniref:Uncharacterized protein n=1 Tax=Streptomyces capitiformicae TaxID=2014920 RepID=A0A918ZV10_9ACTN|nr:hypothetical protein GCM10017771_93210 [Streptomyces capitiformicae]
MTSLTERRLAQRPPDTRPLPSVAAYDQRLRARQVADRPADIGRDAVTLKRHRGLTEHVATAAVDQACRLLRLPTVRAQFPELAEAAARDQMS